MGADSFVVLEIRTDATHQNTIRNYQRSGLHYGFYHAKFVDDDSLTTVFREDYPGRGAEIDCREYEQENHQSESGPRYFLQGSDLPPFVDENEPLNAKNKCCNV